MSASALYPSKVVLEINMISVSEPRPVAVEDRILRLISDELQIPKDRAESAEALYVSIGRWLASGPLREYDPIVFSQGSFSYGTTVKPMGREEFDIDAVVEFHGYQGRPGRLIRELYEALWKCPHFESKPELRERCVRVKAPGRFHVDFVPAVPAPLNAEYLEIPDYDGNEWRWKTVNPKGFTEWFMNRCEMAGIFEARQVEPLPEAESADVKPDLKIAVQLIKRNHQTYLSHSESPLRTPSIVLTALAGHIGATGEVVETMSRVVAYLSAIADLESAPDVRNPANPDEVISEKWADPDVLNAFREWTDDLSRSWQEYQRSRGNGINESVRILNRMFGEKITQTAVKRVGMRLKSVSDARGHAARTATQLAVVGGGLGAARRQYYGASKA